MKNLIEIYDTINHIGEKLVFIGTQIKNKPTKAQYNLLIHILENEKDNMIREGVVHLFENSFQTFELLNEIYIKTDKDELIRTYIQLKIQDISKTTHLSEKQCLLINSFLNTEYHFHIPPTCEKINVAQFTSSFNKRLNGDENQLWVDVDDKICVWLGNFVNDNNLVNFDVFVIQKISHYTYPNYHIPKPWIFAKEYQFDTSEKKNYEKEIISNVQNIYAHILSFKDISFTEFKERDSEFIELMIEIDYDFGIEDLSEGSTCIQSIVIGQMIQLIWLFNQNENYFNDYEEYMINLFVHCEDYKIMSKSRKIKFKKYIQGNFKKYKL